MPTYLLKSNQVPAIIAPAAPAIGNGVSSPGDGKDYRSGLTIASNILNQMTNALEAIARNGVGGNAVMGEVGSGLCLTAVAGLNVAITPGIALMDRVIEFVNGLLESNNYQAPLPPARTLTDNTTNYVWLTKSGTLVSDVSTTPPALSRVYLGAVTTASGAITNIDLAGVVGVSGGMFTRTLGDSYAPSDTPPLAVVSKCLYGSYLWNGAAHSQLVVPGKQIPQTFNHRVTTGTASIQLLPDDAYIQQFDPGTGTLTVHLPDPTKITVGHGYNPQHVGAAGTVVIKSFSGTSTVATLTAGEAVTIAAQGTPASPGWPSTVASEAMPSLAS